MQQNYNVDQSFVLENTQVLTENGELASPDHTPMLPFGDDADDIIEDH